MDIVIYLLELIETRKNVGINALGTLYKKKTPGKYNPETHSFIPPKYEIAFTTEVKEDQELMNFISEDRNISVESANYYITEFVEKIQAQLADHQEADFSPLGKLKLIDNEIVLEASETIEIGFASYGLPIVAESQNQLSDISVSGETTDQEMPFVQQNSETDNQPVYDESAEVSHIQEQNENEERIDIKQEEPIQHTEISPEAIGILDPEWNPAPITRYEYEEEEDRSKNRWLRMLIKAGFTLLIFFAVISVLIYFISPNLFYTIKEKFVVAQVQRQSVEVSEINTIPKIDSPKTDSLVKENVATTTIAKDTISTRKSVNNTITYEVIGGAMKTQKKVDEVILNFTKRGIAAKRIESMPGRLIKISLGTFTDYNLAKKFQDSLKIKLKNPELYIQTIKPKN